MRDRETKLDRRQATGERRRDVADYHHRVRPEIPQGFLEALCDRGQLCDLGSGSHVEVDVRLGKVQVAKEHVRHGAVVVLPGVHHQGPDLAVLLHLDNQRGQLDKVRPATHDVHYPQIAHGAVTSHESFEVWPLLSTAEWCLVSQPPAMRSKVRLTWQLMMAGEKRPFASRQEFCQSTLRGIVNRG